TSLLFTRGASIEKDPELVRKMTRACVRGWRTYLSDPDPAHHLINAANPEMTLEALTFGFRALTPLCLPNSAPPESVGRMTPERWQTLTDQLIEIKLLEPGKVRADEAYRLEFMPE
ncbi:MAG TPA: ABC transporter permease, partial [Pirellulaceae bacterium]|nr:ABC transporter permease [Pirellulaceae bacterium]